ncbi:MAG: hypothetical protein U0Z74_00285 [Romboutsia timonensis]
MGKKYNCYKCAAKDSQDAVSIEENQRTSNENELANNVITVDGIPYFETNIERFRQNLAFQLNQLR